MEDQSAVSTNINSCLFLFLFIIFLYFYSFYVCFEKNNIQTVETWTSILKKTTVNHRTDHAHSDFFFSSLSVIPGNVSDQSWTKHFTLKIAKKEKNTFSLNMSKFKSYLCSFAINLKNWLYLLISQES